MQRKANLTDGERKNSDNILFEYLDTTVSEAEFSYFSIYDYKILFYLNST